MNDTTGGKVLVGKVRHIFRDHGVFGTTAECCLTPGQTISVEGVEGFHSIDSLEIDHMRHDRVGIGSHVAIKAVTIPIGWLDYDARIWLHVETKANHAGSQPAVPRPEHDGSTEPPERFSLDG